MQRENQELHRLFITEYAEIRKKILPLFIVSAGLNNTLVKVCFVAMEQYVVYLN